MWKKASWVTFGIALAVVAVEFKLQDVQARPKYNTVFHDVYPDYQFAASKKCNICHADDKKTSLNEYGTAVEEALGARNVKDKEAKILMMKK